MVLNGINFKADQYDYLEVTIKTTAKSEASELYIVAGSYGGFSATQCEPFGLLSDGEAHTYRLPLSIFTDYTGSVRGLRFDINGKVDSKVEITDLKIFKGDYGDAPTDLTLQRSFLTYSDKLHHLFQISAYKEVKNIQKVERVGIDKTNKLYVNNGEWQIVIFDLASLLTKDSNPDDANSRGFKALDDGKYYAKVLRIDPFNSKAAHQSGLGISFGFIGICGEESLEDAIKFDTSVDAVLFYDGKVTAYAPESGSVIEDYQTPIVTPPTPSEEETTEEPAETETEELLPAEQVEGYNRFFDSDALTSKGSTGSGMGRVETITEDGVSFTRFYGTGTKDPQFYLYRASQDSKKTPTGQCLVFKYRLPDGCTDNNWIDFFTNTTTPNAANNYSLTYSKMIKDGEWHVVVFDLAKSKPGTFIVSENGGYYAQHLRVDIFGGAFPESVYIDVEFIAFDDSLDEILEANKDLGSISYYDGEFKTINTTTLE